MEVVDGELLGFCFTEMFHIFFAAKLGLKFIPPLDFVNAN